MLLSERRIVGAELSRDQDVVIVKSMPIVMMRKADLKRSNVTELRISISNSFQTLHAA